MKESELAEHSPQSPAMAETPEVDAIGVLFTAMRGAPAAPSVGEPSSGQEEAKPLTDRERGLILQRCRNYEAGHDTGLTSRAVCYLYDYEALVSALRSSLEEARKDSERLDAIDRFNRNAIEKHAWFPSAPEFRPVRELVDELAPWYPKPAAPPLSETP